MLEVFVRFRYYEVTIAFRKKSLALIDLHSLLWPSVEWPCFVIADLACLVLCNTVYSSSVR